MTNTTLSSTTIQTATYFTFDHIRKQIVGSEFNFKMAGNPAKAQYEALMDAMNRHPNYALTPVASSKKVEQKKTYAGLNTKLMTDYIAMVGNEVQKETIKHMVDTKVAYPTIKSWFLGEFEGFNVKKAERQIAKNACEVKKENVRKVVKVKMAESKSEKATANVVELPKASNF